MSVDRPREKNSAEPKPRPKKTPEVPSDLDQLDAREMLRVLTAVRKGDFTARVRGDQIGLAGKIADTLDLIFVQRGKSTVAFRARVQQLHQNAQDYYNRGKYELAISTISKAIILDPCNYLFCALRASCYFQLNQVERYCADVSKARSINPRWKPGVQIVDREMVNAECE